MSTIAIDARFYGIENTGLGRYTTNVLKYLPTHLQGLSLKVLLRKKYYDTLVLPANCEKVLADYPHYSVSEQLGLPNQLRDNKCELLYSLHFNVPQRVGIPFVVTVHDLIKSHFDDLETTTRNPLMFRLKRLGYEMTIKHAVRDAGEIIVPSNTVKNDILATFDADPTYIHAIPEAPDDIFRYSHNSKILNLTSKINLPKKFILFVGNPYPHKNLMVLLRAMESMNDTELVIVAHSSPFLDKIMRKVGEDTKKRITILENLTDQELVSVYQNAQALVTPSLIEGYGLPGLEALMVGTPVIASNIPVYREVYGANVTYFDPTSSGDLVRAIREGTKKQIRALSIKRTWDDVAREIAEVLDASCSRL